MFTLSVFSNDHNTLDFSLCKLYYFEIDSHTLDFSVEVTHVYLIYKRGNGKMRDEMDDIMVDM